MEERLQAISLHHEMQRSYLEYAMSVIVGRALPDARDGMKPVQRRILYAMHELGLTPERPFKKCARVVGDVLGKYHPHGDQAVYDALVRLVQSFASRYPVLDGHGNFGSVDDDPPAAMRYTETRLAAIAYEAMLGELGSNTVEFAPNFDSSQQEPIVLPAQLPFLILNGCSGIAVGMATSIPPHNINEVINALIEIIKKPNISEERLLSIIPGPDFPTGGEVLIGTGVKETYLKGKGSIPMRGIAHIEEINPGKGKHKKNAIIITELPYQISKSNWIEKLAEMVNNGKVEGIADIRDESDREGMRIVVELRRDSNPEKILNTLYQRTSLQSNFGATLLAIVNGQPKQLSLKKFLDIFLEFRELTIIRRTKNNLLKTLERLEIVEGLLKALENVRNVIDMIESAKDAMEARTRLMVRLDLTEKQADGILSMPLRRLTNLETQSLYNELEELKEKKSCLEIVLNDRDELLKAMIEELKGLRKQFGSKRKTKLIEGGDELLAQRNASLRPNAELQRKKAYENLPRESRLMIQNDNQVKIVSPQLLGRLHLDESCNLGDAPIPARLIWPIEKNPKVIVVTNCGKIALVKWEFSGNQPGIIQKFIPTILEKEKISSIIPIGKDKELSIGLLTSDGRFKRLDIEEIVDMSGRAASLLKLKENVNLQSGLICRLNDYLIIVSDIGRILKIKIDDENIPIMGKLAQGSVIMKLFPGERIIGAITCSSKEDLIMITKKGSILKHSINSIRTCKRGDLGTIKNILKDSNKEQNRVVQVFNGKSLVGVITSKERNGRISQEAIKEIKYDKINKDLIKVDDDEYIDEVIPLIDPNSHSFIN
ncbi:DNA gyrase/topoisomerase IV subunit A [Prochlorococcus marinus]|uniref:DNA topoisomerase (ATP-hydrolyzing) n=1 Tax=Prochlorococcus marinus (strain MIT 9211) TaxID=93059 RepID=A9B9K2_PROM4|nr:DNA gyrase/topoisomerase IV, subunit A [Prochlorococcus marinus str. MIT 9211]